MVWRASSTSGAVSDPTGGAVTSIGGVVTGDCARADTEQVSEKAAARSRAFTARPSSSRTAPVLVDRPSFGQRPESRSSDARPADIPAPAGTTRSGRPYRAV